VSEKLKPCPFCGNASVKIKTPKDIYPLLPKDIKGSFSVYCAFCGTIGPEGDTTQVAAQEWNSRAEVTNDD